MKGSDQVGARRRVAVAALAAVLAVSVISVVTASARPVARHMPSAKRVSSELFDSRATGASVAPSRAVVRARAALARRLGSQGVVIADRQTGTLRMVGRLDGFLTGASVRPAAQVGMDYVRSHLRGVRAEPGGPADVPPAAGLRRHRRHAPHLVDPARRRRDRVPERAEGQRHRRRPLDQRHRPARARAAGSRSALPRVAATGALGAARRSAGAQELAPQREDTAKLVLFATQRGARMAWQTQTWVNPDFLALSVVDAQTGERPVAREPDARRRGRHRPGRGDVPRAATCRTAAATSSR